MQFQTFVREFTLKVCTVHKEVGSLIICICLNASSLVPLSHLPLSTTPPTLLFRKQPNILMTCYWTCSITPAILFFYLARVQGSSELFLSFSIRCPLSFYILIFLITTAPNWTKLWCIRWPCIISNFTTLGYDWWKKWKSF